MINMFFNKLIRVHAGLYSGLAFFWRCMLVAIRSQFGKIDRKTMNQYLNQEAKKILSHVKANYKISHVENFKLMENIPRIYMSNHLSLFDTPLFYATIPDTIRIVTKKELTKVPFIGKAIINAEHAIVNRQTPGQNQAFYDDAKKKLLDGIALWIFPEGTRSRAGELLAFRSGGFRLASEVGAQIIPVGIVGTDKILAAGKIVPHVNQSIEIRLGMPIYAGKCKDLGSQTTLLNEVNQTIRQLISAHPFEELAPTTSQQGIEF